MAAFIKFFPLGNADSSLIQLADKRLILIDYANMRDSSDKNDNRCDLAHELKNILKENNRNEFDVVCFTHLDLDHIKGTKEFFQLDYLTNKDDSKPTIRELWVPAAVITETGLDEEDAKAIRREARYRLEHGKGIKVFSRPEKLKKWLEDNGIEWEKCKECVVDAGKYVPGFSVNGAESAEFFVHCPFGWRTNERNIEDRNQDSIVIQITFSEKGQKTYAIFGSDVDSETLTQIVQTSIRKGNKDRLKWDLLKLFHHCSYKALNKDEKGIDQTIPVDNVKWLIEEMGGKRCLIISSSKPIPLKDSDEDSDPQPPHRQAANYYKNIMNKKSGEFMVTMEHPSKSKPKPFTIEITDRGARLVQVVGSAIGTATSKPSRAG